MSAFWPFGHVTLIYRSPKNECSIFKRIYRMSFTDPIVAPGAKQSKVTADRYRQPISPQSTPSGRKALSPYDSSVSTFLTTTSWSPRKPIPITTESDRHTVVSPITCTSSCPRAIQGNRHSVSII